MNIKKTIAFLFLGASLSLAAMESNSVVGAASTIRLSFSDSQEGEFQEVPRAVADCMGIVKNMLEDLQGSEQTQADPIPLANVTKADFELLLPILKWALEQENIEEAKLSDFIKSHVDGYKALRSLINTGNYLNISFDPSGETDLTYLNVALDVFAKLLLREDSLEAALKRECSFPAELNALIFQKLLQEKGLVSWLENHPRTIQSDHLATSIAFDPHIPGRLASVSNDGTVKVWNLSRPVGQECIRTLQGHNDGVRSIVFDPHIPDRLASGSDDNTIHVWDLSRPVGQERIRTLQGHNDWVRSIVFDPHTPDRLASGSTNGTINVWDLLFLEKSFQYLSLQQVVLLLKIYEDVKKGVQLIFHGDKKLVFDSLPRNLKSKLQGYIQNGESNWLKKVGVGSAALVGGLLLYSFLIR